MVRRAHRAWPLVSTFAVVALGLLPARAAAERALLLAVTAEPGAPLSARAAVERAAADFFTRRSPHVELLARAAVWDVLPPLLRTCAAPDCAREVVATLSIDFAILLHVFAPDPGDRYGSISVALIGAAGLVYGGTRSVGQAGMTQAAAGALALADERRRRGPGPWLRVRAPAGGRVRIDGGPAHGTPYLDRHEPGIHGVEVRTSAGEVLYEGAITLADDPAGYEEIDLTRPQIRTLKPSRVARPSAPYFLRPRSAWNLYLGIPLTLTGAGLLSAGVAHYLKRGDCLDDACTQVHTVNALSKTLLATGAALTVLPAVGFLAVGVIRESAPDAPARGAWLRIAGSF